ncbi:MAG: DUF58 domain-containing protein [Planctomycetota bacterium]|nr:MAG: DUF58 domain-containing protein [Planctomycetota bacterium]
MKAGRPSRERHLAAPSVRFAPDFARRLERLVVQLAAARERREGAGGAGLTGGGDEFVGYRPYVMGEDLRQLDWNLLARLDRPYVRVTRREAAERWSVFIDASASMGVGSPGKLQCAAEVACALACIGLRMGARVELLLARAGAPAEFAVVKKTDLAGLFAFFEAQRASGERGLAAILEQRRPPADAGRVFLIGDLEGLDPRAVLALLRRGRELFAAQILAPIELTPPAAGAVEWLDPEGRGRIPVMLEPGVLARYGEELDRQLEAWGALAGHHGFAYGCFRSDQPFEDVAAKLLLLGRR